jgi:hypothetical protein
MSDSLKLFIQHNRQEFDNETPGLQCWESLTRSLERLPVADPLEKYLIESRELFDTEQPSALLWDSVKQQIKPASGDCALEMYISENREALDAAQPVWQLWTKIETQIGHSSANNWKRKLYKIAAAVALLLTGLAAGIWYEKNGSRSMEMADVSPEYAELERYYESDIIGKKEKLATFTGSQSADVFRDLEQLDQTMEELKRELASVPPGNRQQVVRAMIENYQSKTAILQRVLEHLEEDQNRGKNSKLSHEVKNM